MPIGLVDDSQFLQELASLKSRSSSVQEDSVTQVEILDIQRPGRQTGDVNVPDALRQIIGEESVINSRQSALGLAGMFGISPSSVSAYAKGATSTASYDSPSKSIIGHINKSRRRAIKRASTTLNQALEAITQEKLDYTDAKDLSGIAKDMSVIIRNLEPQVEPQENPEVKTPQFVIYAPQFKDERSFEVITINE